MELYDISDKCKLRRNTIPESLSSTFYLLEISARTSLSLQILLWTTLRRVAGSLSWFTLCKSTQGCCWIIHGNKEAGVLLQSYLSLVKQVATLLPVAHRNSWHMDRSSSTPSTSRKTTVLATVLIPWMMITSLEFAAVW